MLAKTHLAFGALAALVMLIFIDVPNVLLFFFLVLLGTYIPDIDQSESKINRKLIFTKIIPMFVRHRGLFHSILAAIILSVVLWFALGSVYGFGIFIGYLSHLVSDGLTVSGVRIFQPFSKFRIRGPIKTGTYGEYGIFVIVLAIDVLLLIRAF
jgi:inner membrane protein